MCGIVGGWWKKKPRNLEIQVSESLDLLRHRGPNARHHKLIQITPEAVVVLGHTRLSIIDLSYAASQPMSSLDGRFTMIFNGELYNFIELRSQLMNMGHVFTSNSDTEVLLQAWIRWGTKCLTQIVGMFSFVVFDARENTLTCVRDAFGIKPFFYIHDKTKFLFSSEPSAL